MSGTGEKISAEIKSLSELPGSSSRLSFDNSGASGVIHRIESNTASIKFTGTVVTGLSEEEISSEEEQDYSLKEIGPVDEETLKKINEKFVPEDDDDIVKLEIDLKNRSLSESTKEETVSKSVKSNTSESPSHFKQSRFNPFDKDLHMDEDYFEDNNSRPHSGNEKLIVWLSSVFI